ncbi:hypothetical protein C6P40_000235 [Pichia californica]|uniref:NEDD8-activating enzyme E1 regulatory subunit n=1 Tax=Pichia californica TaxID=460514 RepID=A0A9P7BGP2_9ASCO|nr:hypothetical protein C6P42_000333 [[Candida] californica]KAG0688999.1 hypothetical protein C6P40_000235 [[Candida] californica]
MDDINFGSKYDRQVRLWNSNGQQSLTESKICIINVSTTASELLKNLVLPGVGSIVIIDSSKISQNDLSTNFFLQESDLGSYKAENLAKNLKILNPDISITPITNLQLNSQLFSSETSSTFWKSFDCVIYCSISNNSFIDNYQDQLSNLLWELDIPLLKLSSIGFFAYLRIQLNEQTIIESHESNFYDLRIDHPWNSLQNYINSIDISYTKNENYYKIPYSIILTKLIQTFKYENDNKIPTTSQIRKCIKSLYKTGDESNLDEAYNKAYLIMKNSTNLSNNIKYIFNNVKCLNITKSSSLFWILTNALKSFYDIFHILPITGILPDMESDTKEYINLKNLYTEKFNIDKKYIKEKVIKTLKSLDRSPNEILNNEQLLDLFLKNSHYLKVIKGTKWDSIDKILEIFKTDDEHLKNKALIYLAFLSFESYSKEYKMYPTINDNSKLRAIAISILCKNKDIKTFPEGLEKMLDELSRSNGNELHNICSIIGGIAAQEVIKILTNQYIPLDNCLVFNGITGKTSSFKL